jgi:hypothetical protein
MNSFIHSVYRQELKLKKKGSLRNAIYFFIIYLLIYSGLCGLFTDAVRIFD